MIAILQFQLLTEVLRPNLVLILRMYFQISSLSASKSIPYQNSVISRYYWGMVWKLVKFSLVYIFMFKASFDKCRNSRLRFDENDDLAAVDVFHYSLKLLKKSVKLATSFLNLIELHDLYIPSHSKNVITRRSTFQWVLVFWSNT